MEEEVSCYLYWIRTEEMTDIFTEGYVGITHNPSYRYQQHKSNAKTNSHHKYKKAFRKALLEESTVLEIKLISTAEYCLDIERKLRPYINVGWNRAIGGDGGYNYKHGLSGSKCKGAYYNMRIRAEEQGSSICEEWLGDGALERFCEFYNESTKDGGIIYTANLKHMSPETVLVSTRQQVIAERYRVHDLYKDGVLYNINEVAEMFSIKPNTIASGMSRGWTIRQTVGLDEKPKRVVVIEDKIIRPYRGKLSDEDITNLKLSYESGSTLTELAEIYEMDTGNMSRLVRRFGFERKSRVFKDLMGGTFTTTLKSSVDLDGYNLLVEKLKEGVPRYKIAELLNISGSSVTDLCRRIKWDEYEESMARSAAHLADKI